jgi:hypothetical protein
MRVSLDAQTTAHRERRPPRHTCRHLKVLLCIGPPLSEGQLASKRFTYFLWDLLSPWLAAAALLLSVPAHQAAGGSASASASASAAASAAASALVGQLGGLGGLSDGPAMQAAFLAPSPCHPATPCVGAGDLALPGMGCYWGAGFPVQRGAGTRGSVLWAPKLAAVPLGRGLLVVLLLMMLAHTLLHAFYIAAWEGPHAGNVVRMSAVDRPRDRRQRFGLLEAAWFTLGTSYDVMIHCILAALLVKAVVLGG